jgi:hypothetical protein
MKRTVFSALCLLISLASSRVAAEDRAKPAHGPGAVTDPQASISTQKAAAEALESRCSIGPVTGPLKEVLGQFSENGKVHIIVDAEDFKRDGIADVNTQQVILPSLERVRFKRALQMALDQIGATYIVSDGDIIVGTQETLLPKKKIQIEVEYAKAERALRNQMEDLRDRRRLEMAELPRSALSNQPSANADLDKRLEEIEQRLAAIEKRLDEKLPGDRKGHPNQSESGAVPR